MNNSTIVKLKTESILTLLKESYVLLIMFVSYIFGAILGASLLNKSNAVNQKAKALFEAFRSVRGEDSFVSTFVASLLDWLPLMLLTFVAGTCIAGMVILPLFISYK